MPQHITGIDHLVILVGDLDASAATYGALGFTISPRGMHSAHMGTGNHTIMLQDDYFELLAPLTPTEQNGPMRERLGGGDGLYATALRTDDAAGMHRELSDMGIGATEPVDFQRPVDLPGGGTGEAAFRVTRIVEPGSPRDELFGCQHLTRDTVWLPSLMEHANGAVGILAVDAVAGDPAHAAEALAVLFGSEPQKDGAAVSLAAGDVALTIAPGDAGGRPFRLTGMTLGVSDIVKTKAALSGTEYTEEGGAVVVPANAAHGVTITFKEENRG